MNWDHRYLAERLACNLFGKKYHKSADFFGNVEYMSKFIKKCMNKFEKLIDELECHEELKLSIKRHFDFLKYSLKDKENSSDYFPTIHSFSIMWNLLGGFGEIRYWNPEYAQDLLGYLNQKAFLEKGDMCDAQISLEKSVHIERINLIKVLKEKKWTTVEISEIMNLPESRVRKILREL